MSKKSAMYWHHEGMHIRCQLCPQNCLISEGKYGLCKTRKNENNHLYAINYEQVTSIALDPIEKKPLFHYKPGHSIISLGTFGCNMTCSFCQNYTISQHRHKTNDLKIHDIKHLLDQADKENHNVGIAFTYNEPFMWYEYILDTAKYMKETYKDLSIVIVSNGYINEEPLTELLPYVDAINIDLKAYTSSYYRKICGAKLEPVLNTIRLLAEQTHVEITTLMVTGENDSEEEVAELAEFIASVDPNIPLHLTRYYPNYKMCEDPTDIDKMLKGKERALEYLNYVYIGNVGGIDLNSYCHHCGQQIVNRNSKAINTRIHDGRCMMCLKEIPFI
ncbi:AmmeMemoRadiSam system radical SAM enzyme [Haloplasma contractile]|uniref:Pyruvate-formate lyase-activating enzyme protein n=1 Tax=Haloplasma contractile SSD-17B TaxID=1033810 RepID=U2DRH9_9MOLU|nr:AmmeMemoRadiSam system radical SAM enzyme [Haloplasma contractile]ERJ11182.1 Pyruvate-formate lyase-activating enzyme protein [Haloplasma contractile SSD-17B]